MCIHRLGAQISRDVCPFIPRAKGGKYISNQNLLILHTCIINRMKNITLFNSPDHYNQQTKQDDFSKQKLYAKELFDSKTNMKQIVQKIEKEIEKFTEDASEGRERRKLQLDRLTLLGSIPQKKPKTPFRILKGIREKEKHRSRKQKELSRQSGMLNMTKKQKHS